MSSSERPPRTADGPEGTKLRITWVKSSIGYSRRQKGTIRALGFRRLGDVVEQADTPVIGGWWTGSATWCRWRRSSLRIEVDVKSGLSH